MTRCIFYLLVCLLVNTSFAASEEGASPQGRRNRILRAISWLNNSVMHQHSPQWIVGSVIGSAVACGGLITYASVSESRKVSRAEEALTMLGTSALQEKTQKNQAAQTSEYQYVIENGILFWRSKDSSWKNIRTYSSVSEIVAVQDKLLFLDKNQNVFWLEKNRFMRFQAPHVVSIREENSDFILQIKSGEMRRLKPKELKKDDDGLDIGPAFFLIR